MVDSVRCRFPDSVICSPNGWITVVVVASPVSVDSTSIPTRTHLLSSGPISAGLHVAYRDMILFVVVEFLSGIGISTRILTITNAAPGGTVKAGAAKSVRVLLRTPDVKSVSSLDKKSPPVDMYIMVAIRGVRDNKYRSPLPEGTIGSRTAFAVLGVRTIGMSLELTDAVYALHIGANFSSRSREKKSLKKSEVDISSRFLLLLLFYLCTASIV